MNFYFPFYGAVNATALDMQRIRDNNLPKTPLFGAFVAYICAIALASACCLAAPGILRCARVQKRQKQYNYQYNRRLAIFWLSAAGLVLLASVFLIIGAAGTFSELYLRKMSAKAVTALEAVAKDQLDEHYLDEADLSYRKLFELYVGYIKAAFEHNVPMPLAVKQSCAALGDFDAINTEKPPDFAALPDQYTNAALSFVHSFAKLFNTTAHGTLVQLRELGVDVFGAELRLFDPKTPEAEVLKILTFAENVKDSFQTGDFYKQFYYTASYQKVTASALKKRLYSYHRALLDDFNAVEVYNDFLKNLPATALARSVLQHSAVAGPALAAGLPALWAAGLAASIVVLACAVGGCQGCKSGQSDSDGLSDYNWPEKRSKCLSKGYGVLGCRFYAAGLCCASALVLVVLHHSVVLNSSFHEAVAQGSDFQLLRPYFGAPVVQIDPAEHVPLEKQSVAFDPAELYLSLAGPDAFAASFSAKMSYNRRISFYAGHEALISSNSTVTLPDAAFLTQISPLASNWLSPALRYDGGSLRVFKAYKVDGQIASVVKSSILFQIGANLNRLREIFNRKTVFTVLSNGSQQCQAVRPIHTLRAYINTMRNASAALASYQRSELTDGLTLDIYNRNSFILLFSLLNSLHFALSDVRTGAQALLVYYGSAAFAAYYENKYAEAELRARLEWVCAQEIFTLEGLKEPKDPRDTYRSHPAATLFGINYAELDDFADYTQTEQFEQDFARRFSGNTYYIVKIYYAFQFCCLNNFPCTFSYYFTAALRSVQFAARFQRADVIISRIKADADFGAQIDEYLSYICVAAHYNLAAVQNRLETSAAAQEINMRIRVVLSREWERDLKKDKDLADLYTGALLAARSLHAGQIGAGALALLLLAAGFAALPEFVRKQTEGKTAIIYDEPYNPENSQPTSTDYVTQQRQMMLYRVARESYAEQ